jgi:hypothetical protein
MLLLDDFCSPYALIAFSSYNPERPRCIVVVTSDTHSCFCIGGGRG